MRFLSLWNVRQQCDCLPFNIGAASLHTLDRNFCLTYNTWHRETSKAFLLSKHKSQLSCPACFHLPSASLIPAPPTPFSTLQLWIIYGFCFPSRFWYMLHKHSWQSNSHGNWIMRWMVDDGLRLPHPVTSPVWIRWGLRLVSCSYEILWLSDL